jgi:hypothetical protein
MSAIAHITDSTQTPRHVRDVPNPDSCGAANWPWVILITSPVDSTGIKA